ncbi:MAG: guanylate kinase [Lachnospiraceae bacterium]
MNQRGILVVVSGFSGSGKGTLMKALLERYDNYSLSISATTRSPRPGEADGREYFFVSQDRFEQMIRAEELIEYAKYVNNYYGTPKSYVLEQMDAGKDVILEIEIQGALKVKEKFPDTLLLFVMPPSAQELRHRLTGRGTETQDVIEARLKRAADEADSMISYDYILINDDIDGCVEQMHQLIQSQHYRVSNNLDFMNQMKEDLKHI